MTSLHFTSTQDVRSWFLYQILWIGSLGIHSRLLTCLRGWKAWGCGSRTAFSRGRAVMQLCETRLRKQMKEEERGVEAPTWLDGRWGRRLQALLAALPFSRSGMSDSVRPWDCSSPGFPVLPHLLESAQTHVLCVGDVIQPSHPLSSPSPAFNLSQHQDLFQ